MHACEGLGLGVLLHHSRFWMVCLACLPQGTAWLQLPCTGITGFYMSGVDPNSGPPGYIASAYAGHLPSPSGCCCYWLVVLGFEPRSYACQASIHH